MNGSFFANQTSTSEIMVRLVPSSMFKAPSNFLPDRFNAVMSVHCSLVVASCERADLLALLYVMFSCVTFPYGVLGQVWYLIVSISDHCLLPYFYLGKLKIENAILDLYLS